MKLIANETIVTGRGDENHIAPGKEFDCADEKEAARLVSIGSAKPAEVKEESKKEPKK
jgi:hypothetical protein